MVGLEKQTGTKFSYLPYKSGGEAATQLVGKHIDANVNNPSENVEVWRAGTILSCGQCPAMGPPYPLWRVQPRPQFREDCGLLRISRRSEP